MGRGTWDVRQRVLLLVLVLVPVGREDGCVPPSLARLDGGGLAVIRCSVDRPSRPSSRPHLIVPSP